MAEAPDARVVLPVRIRRSSLDRIEQLASTRGVNRSDMVRELLILGLGAAERQPPARRTR